MQAAAFSREAFWKYYRSSAFVGEMEMLPPVCRVAVRLQRVQEQEEEAVLSVREIMKRYEDCLGVFPPMDETIRNVIRLAGEKEKKRLSGILDSTEAQKKMAKERMRQKLTVPCKVLASESPV